MKFDNKNINNKNFMGVLDENGVLNSIGFCDYENSHGKRLYYGQIKNDNLNGFGVRYCGENDNKIMFGTVKNGLTSDVLVYVNGDNNLIVQTKSIGIIIYPDGNWFMSKNINVHDRHGLNGSGIKYDSKTKKLEFVYYLSNEEIETQPIKLNSDLVCGLEQIKFNHLPYKYLMDNGVVSSSIHIDKAFPGDCDYDGMNNTIGKYLGALTYEDGSYYIGEIIDGLNNGFGMQKLDDSILFGNVFASDGWIVECSDGKVVFYQDRGDKNSKMLTFNDDATVSIRNYFMHQLGEEEIIMGYSNNDCVISQLDHTGEDELMKQDHYDYTKLIEHVENIIDKD